MFILQGSFTESDALGDYFHSVWLPTEIQFTVFFLGGQHWGAIAQPAAEDQTAGAGTLAPRLSSLWEMFLEHSHESTLCSAFDQIMVTDGLQVHPSAMLKLLHTFCFGTLHWKLG